MVKHRVPIRVHRTMLSMAMKDALVRVMRHLSFVACGNGNTISIAEWGASASAWPPRLPRRAGLVRFAPTLWGTVLPRRCRRIQTHAAPGLVVAPDCPGRHAAPRAFRSDAGPRPTADAGVP